MKCISHRADPLQEISASSTHAPIIYQSSVSGGKQHHLSRSVIALPIYLMKIPALILGTMCPPANQHAAMIHASNLQVS